MGFANGKRDLCTCKPFFDWDCCRRLVFVGKWKTNSKMGLFLLQTMYDHVACEIKYMRFKKV